MNWGIWKCNVLFVGSKLQYKVRFFITSLL
jgi:hypothetical protein